MIPAGQLRHKLTVQLQQDGTGSRGQASGSWVKSHDTWAMMRTLNGREAEQARKVYAEATIEVVTRVNNKLPLTPEHRFQFGDQVLHIGHINNEDQLNQIYRCLCKIDVDAVPVTPRISVTFQPFRNIRQAQSITFQPVRNLQKIVAITFNPKRDIASGLTVTFQPRRDIRQAQSITFNPVRDIRKTVSITFNPKRDIEAGTTPISVTFQPVRDIGGSGPVIPSTAIQALWFTE